MSPTKHDTEASLAIVQLRSIPAAVMSASDGVTTTDGSSHQDDNHPKVKRHEEEEISFVGIVTSQGPEFCSKWTTDACALLQPCHQCHRLL